MSDLPSPITPGEVPQNIDQAYADLVGQDVAANFANDMAQYIEEGNARTIQVGEVLRAQGLVPPELGAVPIDEDVINRLVASPEPAERQFAANVERLVFAVMSNEGTPGVSGEPLTGTDALKRYNADQEIRRCLGSIVANADRPAEWVTAAEQLLGTLPLSTDLGARAAEITMLVSAERLRESADTQEIRTELLAGILSFVNQRYGSHDENEPLAKLVLRLATANVDIQDGVDDRASRLAALTNHLRNEISELQSRIGLPDDELERVISIARIVFSDR